MLFLKILLKLENDKRKNCQGESSFFAKIYPYSIYGFFG